MNRYKTAISFLILFTFCVFESAFALQEQGQRSADVKQIYIAADDHTDYFWTADDVEYRAAFIEMLDYFLDQIDQTENEPHDFQTRWNCDGSLWMWEYEHHKSKPEFERLMKRVADGHISMPLNALVSTYGAQPAEAVLRGMYYAGDLERRFDVRFPMAVAMENQTLPLGVGALWAGAGAKYSWKGICGCATKMPYPPFQRRDHEVYWWKGLDDSRILMKWYSLGNNNESLGGYAEARNPIEAIRFANTNTAFQQRHQWKTIGLFGQGWDDLKTLTNSFPAVARRLSNEQQRVIVSNEEDYFRAFERRHGGELPVESQSFGNEWDVLCASMAKQTSKVRRAVEKLRTAELLSVWANQNQPDFWSRRKAERELAHLNLGLYWEHDWTSDANETMRQKRAVWQRKLADQISGYVEGLCQDAAQLFAAGFQCHDAEDDRQCFAVVNALGQRRADRVVIDCHFDGPYVAKDLITNKSLRWSYLNGTPGRRIAVKCNDVAATGYALIEISKQSTNADNRSAVTTSAPVEVTLENENLRVTVSSNGIVEEVFAKSLGRNVAGSRGLNRLLIDGQSSAPPVQMNCVNAGASQFVKIEYDQPLKYSVTMRLDEGNDWFEIENQIDQNFDSVVAWQFDARLEEGFRLRHEEVGAVLTAELKSKGGHYADRNARYDWLSAGHFVQMSDGQTEITISNLDCCFFQFGNSQPTTLDTTRPSVKFLVGGQVDGPDLGIRQQDGDENFSQRFAVRVAQPRGQSRPPMRWALERTNPLSAVALAGRPVDLESAGRPLIEVADRAVSVWAAKPAESGRSNETIVRLWNQRDSVSETVLGSPKLKTATEVTHIETDVKPVPVVNRSIKMKLKRQQMKTYRIATE